MKIKHLLWLLILAVPMLVVGCKSDDPVAKDPTITLTAGEATETTLSFTINTTDATGAAWMVVAADQTPSATDVLKNGTAITPNKEVKATAEALEPGTDYIVAAAVAGNAKTDLKTVAMSTVALPQGEELTFVMESAERVATDSETTYSLKFYGEEQDVELSLVLYAEAELAGAYTLAEGTEAGTASKEESFLLVYSTEADYSFDEGEVIVAEEEGVYTFAMTFTSGLDTINVSYEGEVANLNPINELSLTFDKAARDAEAEQQEGEYYITLTNSEVGYSLNLLFVGEAADMLPAGEYTLGAESNSVTIAYLTGDSEEIFTAESGKVVVSVEEGNYTFDIDFAYANTTAEGYYAGAVENMKQGGDDPIVETVKLTKASSVSSGADHTVTFTNDDESIKLKADIYTYDSSFGYLSGGEYTVINSGYSFKAGEIDYYYSSLTLDGVSDKLNSGTINVTLNEDYTYSVVIDVVDASSRALKATFEGEIEGMSFERGYDFVAALLNEVEGAAAGVFNITFKTAGTDYADYLTMDFYADAQSSSLPAGIYAVTDQQSAGSVDSNTIVFTTFSYGEPVINGGEVVVDVDQEGNYTFAFNLQEKDSMVKWVCSYDGPIAGMPTGVDGNELNIVSANGYYSSDSAETYVYLVTEDGKQLKLGLIDLGWKSEEITAGVYTVSGDWSPGSIYSGWYGTDWNDGIAFSSGTATISHDGEGNYTIVIEITLTNGETYTGSFTGRIEGISPDNKVVSAWGLTGTINSWDASNPIAMYVVDGYHVAYGVTLDTSSEIKFVKDKSWTVNRGGVASSKPNHYYGASQDGANIKVTEAGTYDIYLNEALDTYYIMSAGKLPSEAVEDVLYELRGDFEDNNWLTGITLTLVDGYYVAEDVVFANANNQGLAFKILKNGAWMGSASSDAYDIHTAIDFSDSYNNNILVNGEVGVKYDFYVDHASGQVWVMSDGCKPGDALPGNEPIVFSDATLTQSIDGRYVVRFSDADSVNMLFIQFFSDAGYVPAGNYTIGFYNFNFDQYNSYLLSDGVRGGYESGDITVDLTEDNTYTFTFNDMVFGEHTISGSWTGKISGLAKPSVVELNFNKVAMGESSTYGYPQYIFTDEANSYTANIFFAPQYGYPLQAGTYVPGFSGVHFDSYDSKVTLPDGTTQGIKSGNIVVAVEGDIYTINFDIALKDGTQISGLFEGELYGTSGDNFVFDPQYLCTNIYNLTAYVQLHNAFSIPKIEIYLNINDRPVDSNGVKGLRPGTYTFSTADELAEGEFWISRYWIDDNAEDWVYFSDGGINGGELTVVSDGTNYQILIEVDTVNDGIITFGFEGRDTLGAPIE